MADTKNLLNKSITSKDVAKQAGVSQSTVSRVFNSPQGCTVKPLVKERVLSVAKELGYRPNLVARGMISGRTNIVGLVVGDSLGPFYNAIINSFVKKLQDIGKQCLVFKVPRQDQIDQIIERVIQFQVDAVVITASAMTKVMAETIIGNDIPVVLFNRFIPGTDINTVYVDPIYGSGLVADYLYKNGHRNIGYIQFTRETSEEVEKKVGFYSKLRQHQIYQIQEEKSEYDYQAGYEAGVRMLHKDNPPTAIFSSNNESTLGCLKCLTECGMVPGREIALLGFDDIETLRVIDYKLSVVERDAKQQGAEAMKLLMECFADSKNRQRGKRILVPYQVVLRGSERGVHMEK